MSSSPPSMSMSSVPVLPDISTWPCPSFIPDKLSSNNPPVLHMSDVTDTPMPVPSSHVQPISVQSRTQVLEGGNVGVQDTVKLNLEPLWPHVPVRLNKQKFKPKIPANKRAKPRPNPPTN
ncbi:hypothetical protein BDB01DRAFT_839498 [Pilobolus umbonatus]|nr:hypothetical protein BDB01DRAFT_839498 [Pilobolus umbonatus]